MSFKIIDGLIHNCSTKEEAEARVVKMAEKETNMTARIATLDGLITAEKDAGQKAILEERKAKVEENKTAMLARKAALETEIAKL